MAKLNFYLKLFGYSDSSESTTEPIEQDIDWVKEIDEIIDGNLDSLTRTLSTGDTTIALPAASIEFLYIEVDGLVYLKLNGDAGLTVEIDTPEADERNGVYLKYGTVTGLVINNPGAIAINAKIVLGA